MTHAIARVALSAPVDEIDLESWLFGLSDDDYRACAKGHQGAGVSADELFHLVPVASAVRWTLAAAPTQPGPRT